MWKILFFLSLIFIFLILHENIVYLDYCFLFFWSLAYFIKNVTDWIVSSHTRTFWMWLRLAIDRTFIRFSEVIRRALNQLDYCPHKRRRGHQGTGHARTQWGGGHLQDKERGLGRNQLCQHLDLGLIASRTASNEFLLFKPPPLWVVFGQQTDAEGKKRFHKEDSCEFSLKNQNPLDGEQVKSHSGYYKHGIQIGKEICGQKQRLWGSPWLPNLQACGARHTSGWTGLWHRLLDVERYMKFKFLCP